MVTHPMAAADAAWLRMDRPHNLMVVNTILILDEMPDRGAIDALLREQLLEPFPRFRQRAVERGLCRRPWWVDQARVDLSNHLIGARLPRPGDDTELRAYVGEQLSVPLPRDMPLWQVHLVEGYEGGAAILARMHHCIADGIALTRVLLSLTDEPAPSYASSDPQLAGADAVHDVLGVLAHPSRLVKLAGAVPRVAATLADELLSGRIAPTALVGRIGADKAVGWSSAVPVHDLKAAAHRLDVTLNDLVLAAVAGALRRHVTDRGVSIRDLRVMVPFNLRAPDAPLPQSLGNRFGLVFATLPLTIADPAARAAEVHRRMQAMKQSPEPAVSFGVLGAVGRTTPAVERRLVAFFASKAAGVMTNVPGPDHPVSFAGIPVRRVIPFVPLSGDQALGISIFSYAGEVVVGFVADTRVVPGLDGLAGAFAGEIALLAGAGRRGSTA